VAPLILHITSRDELMTNKTPYDQEIPSQEVGKKTNSLRRLLFSVAAVIICSSPYAQSTGGLEQFPTEESAQAHCPKDTVVWLNLPTMIWHYKGQRWYGRTKHGTYVCEKEAAASGARATHNGE
jgi:hypothetical protein